MKSSTAEKKLIEAAEKLAERIKINKYGDLEHISNLGYKKSDIATLMTGHGKHTKLPGMLRCYQVVCWTKKYGPKKKTGYVVTDRVMALYDAYAKALSAEKKAQKKKQDQADAKAAGFATVAEHKRHIREIKKQEKLEAQQELERDIDRFGLSMWVEDMHRTDQCRLVNVLLEAEEQNFDITDDHVQAVVFSQKTRSGAWRAYMRGELYASQLLHRTERAQNRHENTNYEELLARGYDRDDAREIMR